MSVGSPGYIRMASEAVTAAWRHTGLVLFRRDWADVWFGLGFCAWLATLGEGGGGGSAIARCADLGVQAQQRQGAVTGMQDALRGAVAWVTTHLGLVLALVGVVVVAATVVWLALLWLSSRGKFMFLAGVCRNRAEVVSAWRESADLGFSLFVWRAVYALIAGTAFALFLGAAGGALYLAWGSLGAAIATGVGAGLLLLALVVLTALIGLALDDFVVPLMYRYQLRATAAWGYFLALARLHPLGFAVYVGMRIVVGMAVGLGTLMLVLLTCCVAGCLLGIPYLGTVLFLPVLVFNRCLGVCFLEQFHPDYRMRTGDGDATPGPVAPGPGAPTAAAAVPATPATPAAGSGT